MDDGQPLHRDRKTDTEIRFEQFLSRFDICLRHPDPPEFQNTLDSCLIWCRTLAPYRQNKFYQRLVGLFLEQKRYEQAFEVLTCQLELRFLMESDLAAVHLLMAYVIGKMGDCFGPSRYRRAAHEVIGPDQLDRMWTAILNGNWYPVSA